MAGIAKVGYLRNELRLLLAQYQLIRDCIAGEQIIKKAGRRYLPVPNETDQSAENRIRYAQYLLRAVFYNVTRRTLAGLVGQIFIREPQVEIPNELDPLKTDATGQGVTLEQAAKRMVQNVTAFGRCGLFVDYPAIDSAISKAQIAAGDIRPTLTVYPPWDVINWRTSVVGALEILSLVVISETYVAYDDGFEMKEGMQYRVLRLIAPTGDEASEKLPENYYYQVEIWKKQPGGNAIVAEIYVPLAADGKPLRYIPFIFIGSENNDADCDNPPLYDLASLNIAHYRNSADYEESAFMNGQATPVLSGLTTDWVNTVLKGGVALGARSAIMLPAGAHAALLQAAANGVVKEAMDTKERQMVALGAKLVEQQEVQRTATEAGLESTSESSALATCAQNVQSAIIQALKWCASYVGVAVDTISYKLNTEFDLTKMAPTEITAVVQAWQAGGLAYPEMRSSLRRGGYATLDDAEAQTMIDKEQQARALLNQQNKMPTDPNNVNNPVNPNNPNTPGHQTNQGNGAGQ